MDTTTTTPAKPFTGQDIIDALEQLNRSERGHAAALQLRKLLEADEGYALGLDSENWRALATLCKGCRVFGGHKILQVLPRR